MTTVQIKAAHLEDACDAWFNVRTLERMKMREDGIEYHMRKRWFFRSKTKEEAIAEVDSPDEFTNLPFWKEYGWLLDRDIKRAHDCAVTSQDNGDGFVTVEGWIISHLKPYLQELV